MEVSGSPSIKLYLAGSLYLTVNGVPITSFHSLRTQALFVYLVLEGHQAIQRDDLAKIIWEGYTTKSGRASLRMSLSNLRSLLGSHHDLLVTTKNTVQLKRDDSILWCDLMHVRSVVRSGSQAARYQLQKRLNAFDRIILPEFEALDSPAFIRWLKQQRGQYTLLIQKLQKPETVRQTRWTGWHNLPRAIKTLLGRNQDVRTLSTLLDSAHHPLITLTGPGGVGKTALALLVARQQLSNYADGVWFIRLDKIEPADSAESNQAHVLQQLARTLRFTPRPHGSLLEQLKQHLKLRKMLLIFDNCEHLLPVTGRLIVDLLRDAPQLQIIATSRQPLYTSNETIYYVNGLATDQTATSASVQLFLERVQRMGKPVPVKDRQQLNAIANICRLLNGSPLGIELAAGLCETQTPEALYTSLLSDLMLLTTDMLAIPTRHCNLWKILVDSWQRLTSEEQRVLIQCTVIHNGFSAETATLVTNTPVETFNTLVQHNLITPTQDKRYTIHPQIRALCLEQSKSNPALYGWLSQAAKQIASIRKQPLIVNRQNKRLSDISSQHESANYFIAGESSARLRRGLEG